MCLVTLGTIAACIIDKLQSVPMAWFAHFVRVPTFATQLQLVVGCTPKPPPSHLSISKVEHCVLASGV
jgi:hypothetical protein